MSPSDKPSKGAPSRRWRYVAVAILTVLLALPALAYLVLESDFGKAKLVAFLERELQDPEGLAVAIGPLEGSLFSRFSISSLTLSDPEGVWLSAAELEVSWSPWALVSEQRLLIHDLRVASLEVERAPELPESESDGGPIEIPRLPIGIIAESLNLPQITLAQALLGSAAQLSLTGQLRVPEEGDFSSDLALVRTDGIEGELRAKAALDPEGQHLTLELSLSEAAGGIISHLIDDPLLPAVGLKLDGAGTQATWSGHLKGAIEGQASLEGDIELAAAQGYSLDTKGKADVVSLLDAELKPLVTPALAYDLSLELDNDLKLLTLRRVSLESGSLSLNGTAEIELESLALKGKLTGKSLEPAVINQLLDPLQLGSADLDVAFTYDPESFTAEIDGDLADVMLEEVKAANAKITASLSGDQASKAPVIAFQSELELSGFESGIDEADSLAGTAPKLTAEGSFSVAEERLEITNGHLMANNFSAEDISGALDLAALAGEFAGDLTVPDLAALAALAEQELAGIARVNFKTTSNNFAEGLDLSLEGDLRGLKSGIAEADALLGQQVSFSGRAALEREELTVSSLDLKGQHASLTGKAAFTDAFTGLVADYDLSLPELAVLSDSLGLALKGQAGAQGRVEGALEDPKVSGKAHLTAVEIEGIAVSQLDLDYQLQHLAALPQGRLAVKGQSDYGPIDATTDFKLGDDDLTLETLAVTARDAQVSASGPVAISLDSGLLQGDLKGSAGDLAKFSDIAGGSLAGQLDFTAVLTAEDGKQAAKVDAKTSAFRFEDLQVNSAEFTLQSADLLGNFGGTASLSADGIAYDDQALDSLQAKVSGGLDALDFELQARGDLYGPFDLTGLGRLEQGDEETKVSLSKLSGTAIGTPLTLDDVLTLRQGQEETSLSGLSLTYGPGKLTGDFSLGPEQVRLDASFANMPLKLAEALDLGLDVDGSLSGSARLSGAASAPEGALDIKVDDFILDDGSDTPLPKLAALAKVTLGGGRLDLDGEVSGFANRALKLQAAIPASLSLTPFAFEASDKAPLTGSLQFDGSAESLSQLFIDPQERLRGEVYADLDLKGTISDPALSGGLGLRSGTYENLVTGTTLKGLEAVVKAEGSILTIETLSARTGGSGRVNGSGTVSVDPDDNFPIDLSFSFRKARLIERDDVTAAVDGGITLKGDLTKLLLAGKLETTTAELRLIDDLPPEVITIDVIEKNLPASEDLRQRPESASPIEIALDIKLSMPGRVFLRSQDIDTEWSGDFDITGNSDKPVIKGTLRPVRGTISLIGKRFTLQQGSITLDGADELDPLLDLTAVHQKTDLTAIVQVRGRLSDPEIILTSTPPLPEDEVISRVLFDKSANSLTTAEALELASAVASLARGDTGGGVLGSVRSALGLDVLNVGAGQTGSPSVTAGKYLVDGVFVGVDQGTDTDSTRAKVEVDLTPNVKLESEAGADSTGSVGLKWQWDY